MNELGSRESVLRNLVSFAAPLNSISRALSKFPWDCDKELVTLDLNMIENLMRRYIADDATSNELERWANLIECRDDIAFEEKYFETIQLIIYELANPEINEPITRDKGIRILSNCSDARRENRDIEHFSN
jgi:hypothetical protein